VLAQAGVVSLLTDGPVARPGHEAIKDPLDEKEKFCRVLSQVMDMRRGVDVLLSRGNVDRQTGCLVGSYYNGRGALLSGVDAGSGNLC